MRNEQQGFSLGLKLADALEALGLKGLVAHRQDLVYDQDIRVHVNGNGEGQAHEHAGRVGAQGLAQEVAQYDGISVTAVSPSRVVPTPGTIHHKLVTGIDDPKGEPPILMARAALLLASEPAAKINGLVTYSQQILKEFGWIENARGRGVDTRGSGYSEV